MRRAFEIMPGALAWGTLIGMVVASRFLPVTISVFIILFDVYWLLKSLYLSLHLRSTFLQLRENMKIDWIEKLKDRDGVREGENWRDIYHLIVFPMYQEPYEVVRDAFGTLLRTQYPKDRFLVVLAIEERAGHEARNIGERIKEEFKDSFCQFLLTIHPANLQGEIPGKGSNETWAGECAKKELIDPLHISYDHVLVSIFDVDTQVAPHYFGRLTHAFLTSSNRFHAIYQPIPLFMNNIYQAPALARVVSSSSTFWQMMQQSRPERLTSFSSQSIPLKTLVEIGFWQKDIVSEDSRIFWQGYLRYDGDFRVEPLHYPISMDANVASTFWQTMKNTYKQQRRWGWGVENIPYMLEGFRNNPRIPRRKKWYWTWNVLEGFHSWATNALIIFALGWLPIFIGGSAFNSTLLSYNLPHITRFIIGLSMVGIATSAIMSILLLPPRPEWFRRSHYLLYIFQWALIPVTLIIFGALPGLEAQTRLMLGGHFRLGFWATPKTRFVKHVPAGSVKQNAKR